MSLVIYTKEKRRHERVVLMYCLQCSHMQIRSSYGGIWHVSGIAYVMAHVECTTIMIAKQDMGA